MGGYCPVEVFSGELLTRLTTYIEETAPVASFGVKDAVNWLGYTYLYVAAPILKSLW